MRGERSRESLHDWMLGVVFIPTDVGLLKAVVVTVGNELGGTANISAIHALAAAGFEAVRAIDGSTFALIILHTGQN
jgi:hypothetical protein